MIGGAGFLGSTLVDRLLAEGHAVDVIDDLSTGSLTNLADARADRTHDLTFHRVDLADEGVPELLARRPPEVAYLLADPSIEAASALLAQLGGDRGCKVVAAVAGRSAYGPAEVDFPLAEAALARRTSRPDHVAVHDLLDALAWARDEHGLASTALVLATVYGPRSPVGSPWALLPRTAATLLRVQREDGAVAVEPEVADFLRTEADASHDLLYVDDAVDALVRSATRGDGLVMNVSTGSPTFTFDVVDELLRQQGGQVPEGGVAGRDGRDRRGPSTDHFALDASRAEAELGWRPWTSLEEGVASTLASSAGQADPS